MTIKKTVKCTHRQNSSTFEQFRNDTQQQTTWILYNLEYPANSQLGWFLWPQSCSAGMCLITDGLHCVENKLHNSSQSGLSSCLSLCLFSDDSISRALFYESLKNSLVLVRSFTSMWMEGRWFSTKTHRWDGKGWRKIAEGHLQEEPRSLELLIVCFLTTDFVS